MLVKPHICQVIIMQVDIQEVIMQVELQPLWQTTDCAAGLHVLKSIPDVDTLVDVSIQLRKPPSEEKQRGDSQVKLSSTILSLSNSCL